MGNAQTLQTAAKIPKSDKLEQQKYLWSQFQQRNFQPVFNFPSHSSDLYLAANMKTQCKMHSAESSSGQKVQQNKTLEQVCKVCDTLQLHHDKPRCNEASVLLATKHNSDHLTELLWESTEIT